VSVFGGLGVVLLALASYSLHVVIRQANPTGEIVVATLLEWVLLSVMTLFGATVILTLPVMMIGEMSASAYLAWSIRNNPRLAEALRQHDAVSGIMPTGRWADRFGELCLLTAATIMLLPVCRLLF
jgi:hypothetical protein